MVTDRSKLERWRLRLAYLSREVRQAPQLGKMNGKVWFASEAAPT